MKFKHYLESVVFHNRPEYYPVAYYKNAFKVNILTHLLIFEYKLTALVSKVILSSKITPINF